MTSERREILFITFDAIGPYLGGSAIRVLGLARALADLGHSTILAAPRVEDGHPEVPFPIVAFDDARPRESLRAIVEAARVIVLPLFGLARLPFLLREKVPLVFDLYDPILLELLETNADAAELRGHLQLLKQVLRRGDFFLAGTERQRDFWLGALAMNGRVARDLIDVVGFGIDPTRPPEPQRARQALISAMPALANAETIIVWPGGIWDWTDPKTLFEAMRLLADRSPEIHLIIFGDPIASAQKRVHFTGRIPYAERGIYLAGSDVAVSTHRENLESHFAYRTRFFDCFWAGLPIVCTEGDVIADLIVERELGIVVPPENPEELARAFERIATETDFVMRCRERVREVRKLFNWHEAVKPLARFCAEPRLNHISAPFADARVLLDSARRVLRKDGVAETARRWQRYWRSR